MNEQPTLDLTNFFPYQFSILAQQMSEYLATIYKKQHGLSKFEWRVLATVAQCRSVSATGIMEVTRLDKMQVSRAISKLKSQNILVQTPSTTDKRANDVELTALGNELYQTIVPLIKRQEAKLLAHLSAQEREQLIMITQKLSRALDA
mgnify:CR=1 FL=1